MTGVCENCGNQYHNVFKITQNGEEHTFDSFECAIHLLAPHCGHCDSPVIGHGVEMDGQIYCCAHCAKAMQQTGMVDRMF